MRKRTKRDWQCRYCLFHVSVTVTDNLNQGRRHGFESGGTNCASEASRNFLTPHFLASGGTKYGVDISVKA